MKRELTLPELGENVETAVVVAVLISTGDIVEKDQSVIEIETEKAATELPSPYAGVVSELRVKQGDEIKVGQVILIVDEADRSDTKATSISEPDSTPLEEPGEREAAPAAKPTPPDDQEVRVPDPGGPQQGADLPSQAAVPAGPAARRLARELGLDVGQVAGTGPGGRISIEDVKVHARAVITARHTGTALPGRPGDFSRWGEVELQPMSGVRRKTAEAMTTSWSSIPHVTQCDRADITDLEAARRRWANQAVAVGGKLTVTAIVLKAVATALRVFPRFNASLDTEAQQIVLKKYVNIGVAVDAGHGLLVPVIRDADKKNILQIAKELTDISQRARTKKLALDEMRGASFTVSNLGGLGTTYFTPLVNWPEVAVLGVGRARNEAVWSNEAFVPRQILPLSVSYDHRAVDGADAARFLRWIAEALETPLKLALEGL